MEHKKTNVVLISVVLCLACGLAHAQQKGFPAWMNEVKFERQSIGTEIKMPALPIDPSTNKAAEETANKFKAKLPDFSKLREKAVKAELEQKANQISKLDKAYADCLKNEGLLEKQRKQCEGRLAASKNAQDKDKLIKELNALNERIKLENELIALFKVGKVKQSASELAPSEYVRALSIVKQLFDKGLSLDLLKSAAKKPSNTKKLSESSTEDEIDQARARLNKYRPGRIKSVYKEFLNNKKR